MRQSRMPTDAFMSAADFRNVRHYLRMGEILFEIPGQQCVYNNDDVTTTGLLLHVESRADVVRDARRVFTESGLVVLQPPIPFREPFITQSIVTYNAVTSMRSEKIRLAFSICTTFDTYNIVFNVVFSDTFVTNNNARVAKKSTKPRLEITYITVDNGDDVVQFPCAVTTIPEAIVLLVAASRKTIDPGVFALLILQNVSMICVRAADALRDTEDIKGAFIHPPCDVFLCTNAVMDFFEHDDDAYNSAIECAQQNFISQHLTRFDIRRDDPEEMEIYTTDSVLTVLFVTNFNHCSRGILNKMHETFLNIVQTTLAPNRARFEYGEHVFPILSNPHLQYDREIWKLQLFAFGQGVYCKRDDIDDTGESSPTKMLVDDLVFMISGSGCNRSHSGF